MFRSLLASRHTAPVCFLIFLALLYWAKVLFTGAAFLPAEMLRGFAPFGSDPQAPWNLLRWDSLGQYYPWRFFAARELQSGTIPLWNPYQFSGAPFIANGQSAVFYPLNLPFWLAFGKNGVAWAFGATAFLHTLLATLSTYALLQRWKLSREASVFGAIAFGYCGYLASWGALPTLANSAAWLPLCVLLFERSRISLRDFALFSLALCCALLAGHAQVFFYILVALLLRAFFLPKVLCAMRALVSALVLSTFLSAIQLLPMLELARLGHRAGSKPSSEGWSFLVTRALQLGDFPSLILPAWPQLSFSENFGYMGTGVLLCAVAAAVLSYLKKDFFTKEKSLLFVCVLAVFGLLYAMATPLAQLFYFTVPGLSQMGGVGRALVLWSFGIACVAAFGLEMLRARWKTVLLPIGITALVIAELFGNGFLMQTSAPREMVYPPTTLTKFLQSHTSPDARVLLLTPRNAWFPTEILQQNGRTHPPGVLPPNGAMVYGIYDIAGYDSLAPRAYREFLGAGENAELSPALNGNMLLPENINSPALDALSVRYIVALEDLESEQLTEVLRAEDVIVYERVLGSSTRRDGSEFSPGWRDGKYQPETFRLGSFLSLCALALVVALLITPHKLRYLD